MNKLIFYIFIIAFAVSGDFAYSQKKPAVVQPKTYPVLIELFTSEGCSSCLAGEDVLKKIVTTAPKSNKQIFALQYHVDYWNKNGWKDPYSKFQFTNRQKNYMVNLNLPDMYTPMMVVNGMETFVGNDEKNIVKSIDKFAKTQLPLNLELKRDSLKNDTLYLSYNATKADKNFFLRIAITQSNLTSKPNAGENSGKVLNHINVVRIFAAFDMINTEGQIKVALNKFNIDKNCRLTAFIQHKQTSKIMGIASLSF